ncbi:MAG: ParB/RepB/Spo0J family partition protein [Firmicutes bacterium]|jgi:ParB family chromosome partitioning protein|nr:ParB/RepB/Spo0J family partition protein [Bacillota bacterium]
MNRQALGRGLKALIPQAEESRGDEIRQIPVSAIQPNPYQPRRDFDEEGLQELAGSISEKGVLQPITVRDMDQGFQLVAGERRWRAAQIAGLREIPALIRELSDREVMEIALIENLQREDLNPIEEAEAYQVLMREFELTQEQVAKAVGKGRPTIANRLRLLRLPEIVRRWVSGGELSPGHAKVLLMLDEERAIELGRRSVDEGWSVRQLEEYLQTKKTKTARSTRSPRLVQESPLLREVEERLEGVLGTKVKIKDRQGKGKIEVEYYSTEELNRILETIAGDVWD